MEPLLNINQAAQLLGIQPWTLRAWVCRRRIPFVKVGRLVRFDKAKLQRWVEEHTYEPEREDQK